MSETILDAVDAVAAAKCAEFEAQRMLARLTPDVAQRLCCQFSFHPATALTPMVVGMSDSDRQEFREAYNCRGRLATIDFDPIRKAEELQAATKAAMASKGDPRQESTCRMCGRTGWVIDEFTSPHTGLCADCTKARPKTRGQEVAEEPNGWSMASSDILENIKKIRDEITDESGRARMNLQQPAKTRGQEAAEKFLSVEGDADGTTLRLRGAPDKTGLIELIVPCSRTGEEGKYIYAGAVGLIGRLIDDERAAAVKEEQERIAKNVVRESASCSR